MVHSLLPSGFRSFPARFFSFPGKVLVKYRELPETGDKVVESVVEYLKMFPKSAERKEKLKSKKFFAVEAAERV